MRTAGILMPITSLPSPYGVGTLGQCARDFIQFLHRAGQTYWQILPICPTGYGDSPYQSFSSYAGNPYMIDFDDLKKEGLLQEEEYASISWGDNPARVDYSLLYSHKFSILRIACSRISGVLSERFQTFCKEQNVWLNDYALYMFLTTALTFGHIRKNSSLMRTFVQSKLPDAHPTDFPLTASFGATLFSTGTT